jgi:hypothetical protein
MRRRGTGGDGGIEVRLVEEADPGLGAPDDGAVGELDWVGSAPATAQAELEHRVHRAKVVAHGLSRERALLDGDVALDVGRRDAPELLALEERDDVVSQV